jgi:deoxycytidine triphosphate deaminase
MANVKVKAAKPAALQNDYDLPESICNYCGLLRDEEIKAALRMDMLLLTSIRSREALIDRVRQASYELRLSPQVKYLKFKDDGTQAQYEEPVNPLAKTLRIDPGQTVKAYAIEVFNIPTNIVAQVTPVGNLFKLGLSPEISYADPGFDGDFWLIISNFSTRVVELVVGDPIARVTFTKLAKGTTRPHPGSAEVREPSLWPRRVDRRSVDALRQQGVDSLLAELETHDPPHVEHAFIVKAVREQIAAEVGRLRAEADVMKSELAKIASTSSPAPPSTNANISTIELEVGGIREQLAGQRRLLFILYIIGAAWLSGVIYHALPDNLKLKVQEETVKWCVVAVLGSVLFGKAVIKHLSLFFNGSPAIGQTPSEKPIEIAK